MAARRACAWLCWSTGGGRELPVQADFAAARVALPAAQSLALARTEGGKFHFQIKEA